MSALTCTNTYFPWVRTKLLVLLKMLTNLYTGLPESFIMSNYDIKVTKETIENTVGPLNLNIKNY